MSSVEIPGWLSVLALILGSGSVVWMVRGYWTAKTKATDAPGDFRRDYRDILQDERKALQDERAALRISRVDHQNCEERLDAVEGELETCKKGHKEGQARVKELEAHVAELRDLALQTYTKVHPDSPVPPLTVPPKQG